MMLTTVISTTIFGRPSSFRQHSSAGRNANEARQQAQRGENGARAIIRVDLSKRGQAADTTYSSISEKNAFSYIPRLPLFYFSVSLSVAYSLSVCRITIECEKAVRGRFPQTNPGSKDAGLHGLTREDCLVARRLEAPGCCGFCGSVVYVDGSSLFFSYFVLSYFERTRACCEYEGCLAFVYLSTSNEAVFFFAYFIDKNASPYYNSGVGAGFHY